MLAMAAAADSSSRPHHAGRTDIRLLEQGCHCVFLLLLFLADLNAA
jgi:hypothetical protein